MPPLLSAKTCWRAGWVVLGIGVVLMVVLNTVALTLFAGPSTDTLAQVLFTATSVVSYVTPSAGILLLIGSVVVRHVERLTDALVASGTIEARFVQPPERPGRRTPDGAVDLDDDLDDVVEHEPGVR